jgi:medium-chain acyl-[acyl-carrier-protein] hydrolase
MANVPAKTPWFVCFNPKAQGRLRMFCFPHAAGSAAIFRPWPSRLPEAVEVWGLNLPGRGSRLLDPLVDRLPPLVEAIGEAILPLLDRPFVFYGHSMGALVSFELARRLRRRQRPQPAHLFVSSRTAPHLDVRKKPLHQLPESELIEELGQFNGTPQEILDNRELMQLLLPAIRADFAVLETYVHTPDAPFTFPITVFGGFEDKDVSPEELGGWCEHTESSCSVRMLPGDHFFIQTAQEPLLGVIRQVLGSTHAGP